MASETAQIIVFPRGQITPSDREELRAAGLLVVEADDPSKVVTVLPMAPLLTPVSGDDVVRTLIDAVKSSNAASDNFGRFLVRRLADKLNAAEGATR